MTLTEKLQDIESEELALLSELLGIDLKHKKKKAILNGNRETGLLVCKKCGNPYRKYSTTAKCPYPDPITTDLRILSWQVRNKVVEMELAVKWHRSKTKLSAYAFNRETPESWIKAGIEVYRSKK